MPKEKTKKPVKKVTKKAQTKKPVKKPVKKVVAKKDTKSTPKKSTRKKSKTNDRVVVYAEGSQAFWVNDGQVLNSLIALHDALLNMNRDIFEYHVSNEKNDFAEWVEVVLCDDKCASDLRKAKTQNKSYQIVAKHLETYNQ